MTWIPLDFRSYINWIVLGLVGLITFLVSVVAAYMSQPQ